MRIPPPPRAMVPPLAAVAGVVVAHVVDYAVLFPHAGARADHLSATGHAYWPAAVAIAAGAALIALALTVGRGAQDAVKGRDRPGSRFPSVTSLLLFQGLAFVILEAGERGLAGLPPSVVFHSPEFWLGLALQLPVAWLAVRLLAVVERAAFGLVAARRRRPRRPLRRLPLPVAAAAPTRIAVATRARPRAPPLAA